MAFQGTMFFAADCGGSRQYGWSESYWLPTSSALDGALPKLVALAKKRSLLLGAGCSMPYLRVSNQRLNGAGGVNRDSQIELPDFAVYDGKPASVGSLATARQNWDLYNEPLKAEAIRISTGTDVRCDMPYSALLMRLEGTSTNFTVRSSAYLRGLPDYMVQSAARNTDELVGATVWNRAYKNYTDLLKSGDYGISSLDRSDANAPNTISAWDFALAQPKVSLGGGNAIAVGDLVRISGAVHVIGNNREIKDLNGLWRVQTANAGVYSFVGMQSPAGIVGTVKMGTARKQVQIIQAINNIIQRGFRKKNTGSVFDRPHASVRRGK